MADRIARFRANVADAIDTERPWGLLDGDTGEWMEPDATLTVSAANVPCMPGEEVYVLVSDYSPDLPITIGMEPDPGLDRLLELQAQLTDTGGLLGLCQVCREMVVATEGINLLMGRGGPPSQRQVVHLECAQLAGALMRESQSN